MNTPHTPPAVSESRHTSRLDSIIEVISQHQPGMPELPLAWRQWFKRESLAVSAEIARLRAERDELLKACKNTCEALSDSGRWLPDSHQEAWRQAQAAIANATRQ